ncbi:MAG: hypothetical protein J6Z11_14525 [Candidatus Riflebacteria bacterium]|nr:hypothetical protein [Candidatus Riflebacteria bacterium]
MSATYYLAQAEAQLIVQTLKSEIALKANSADLATVATSGSYNDLSNKPTIPTVDQTYGASSANAQSGVAVAEAIATVTTQSIGAIPTSEKGAASGVAQLDANGKVPSAQLPSFVDDVVEGYYNASDGKFYKESTYTTEITGETGKIYVSLDTNKTYRWSGSAFVEISESLALGETSSTAFPGDRGKALETAMSGLATVATSGSYNDLSDKPSIPSNVSDLTNDLDFVESTDLATVATTGDYTDLTNKPTIPTVDQTFDGTSANAQSGVAIAGKLSDYVLASDIQSIPRATVEGWLGITA